MILACTVSGFSYNAGVGPLGNAFSQRQCPGFVFNRSGEFLLGCCSVGAVSGEFEG